MGMIHIYTGDGKGKTSAAVGLAVRMAGRGKTVTVARFLKTEDSGEVEGLRRLEQVTVIPLEKSFGFVWNMTKEEKQEAAAYYRTIWEQAERAGRDGLMAAWKYEFVDRERVLSFLRHLPRGLEVVLTGRDAPGELEDMADYITEMKKIRHPFDRGVAAREGIEY